MRIIVFLTDGYIGAESRVISTIRRRIGNSRIYVFGVGASVNRFLLDAMANEGRGYARYVDPTQKAGEVAETFARSLKSPLLTDISIDWNGLEIEGQTPLRIPDLFAGGSVNVLGRYKKTGDHTIHINGLVNGRKASMPVVLKLARHDQDEVVNDSGLPLVWARNQIAQKSREYMLKPGAREILKSQIIKLGLDFSLQSRFTSFVAVSKTIVNTDPSKTQNAAVPLARVAGVRNTAYPSLNLSGSSMPEPEGLIGFLIILSFATIGFWKRVVINAKRLGASFVSRVNRSTLEMVKSAQKGNSE